MSTLAQAIIQRQYAVVNQYLNSGGEVNTIDEYGFTPLIETAIVNDINLTKLLLEFGADPNQEDLIGGTALHWAVENSNLEMSRLLLSKGANPNASNNNGEPIMVKPILRNQTDLKLLLYENDVSAAFAMDFINAKLVGHRYDMRGSVDIVNPEGRFVEVGMEGFFLEFSLNLVRYSLEQYTQNYAARKSQQDFPILSACISALATAGKLIQFQQYQTDLSQHQVAIDEFLDRELLIIPSNFDGHAITFIIYKDILIKCDRRKINETLNGINVFRMRKPQNMTKTIMRKLIFEKKSENFIEKGLARELDLELKVRVLMAPQMSGNCSWANVVACVPAIYYLLTDGVELKSNNGFVDLGHPALELYQHWRDWDRLRALQYFIKEFANADKKRRASIASLLGTVLFQRFDADNPQQAETARRIIKVLKTPGYEYVLRTYLDYYYKTKRTKAGLNLKKLIDNAESYL